MQSFAAWLLGVVLNDVSVEYGYGAASPESAENGVVESRNDLNVKVLEGTRRRERSQPRTGTFRRGERSSGLRTKSISD